ncbi:MAG: hypothetical protein QXL86_02825 [Candidatus Aenigmatarchaeota archaeon]
MKGQFFLISGAIVVVVLLLIKGSLNLTQIIENKRSLEVSMERKEFLNLKQQLIKTIEYSYNKNESEKIENYLNYVRGRLKSRTMDLTGIAIESTYKNVTASVDSSLNVTVYNLLGETITNLTLDFNGSIEQFYNIEDEKSVESSFIFNTNLDVNYTLTVNYTTSKESKQYRILIPVEVGRSKFIGFFDLRIKGFRVENKDEFSKIVEIV